MYYSVISAARENESQARPQDEINRQGDALKTVFGDDYDVEDSELPDDLRDLLNRI